MGGYESLLVYRLAVTLHDFTVTFCDLFLSELKYKRTVEQTCPPSLRLGAGRRVIQAARSGKQNTCLAGRQVVEGSLEKSTESNIKLTGVARASFGELLEDYKDYLRQRRLTIWLKDDARVVRIRSFRESTAHETNLSNLTNWTNLDSTKGEHFANLMICLLYKENYLLDQLLRVQEDKFVKKGGFRETLFRKRREYLKSKLD